MKTEQRMPEPQAWREKFSVGDILGTYGTVIALLILVVVFWILAPQFISSNNIINLLRQISTLAIMATGLTVCIAAGEFDLSIGNVASLSGIVVSGMMVRQMEPAWMAILVALGCGVVFGLFSGVLVSYLRIPSLVATLGAGAIAVGVNFAYAKGDSIYGVFPSIFSFLGQGFVGPIPFAVIIATAFVIVFYIFLNKTRPGRYIVATGGNPTAARLSGINIKMYRLLGLLISGVSAAVAGIMLTSYLGTGQPTAGEVYLLDSLAAVFLGMTAFRPGQANIAGTLIGVLILGVLANGLNLVGAPFYLQNIIRGAILIFAVSLAVMREEIRFF